MFFLLASCANKVSVLLFYRRVVQGTCTKIYKLSVWAALIFCVLYTVIFSITLWAMCTPVKATYLRYDPTFKEPFHCWSQPTEAWTSQLAGALSVFSDFYALMLPGFLLFQLQIPRQQKIALYCVFSLGFSCASTYL